MRLAGTAIQYSTRAMPQLTTITSRIGDSLNFRWPYQAVVMKMFEPTRRAIGAQYDAVMNAALPLSQFCLISRAEGPRARAEENDNAPGDHGVGTSCVCRLQHDFRPGQGSAGGRQRLDRYRRG